MALDYVARTTLMPASEDLFMSDRHPISKRPSQPESLEVLWRRPLQFLYRALLALYLRSQFLLRS